MDQSKRYIFLVFLFQPREATREHAINLFVRHEYKINLYLYHSFIFFRNQKARGERALEQIYKKFISKDVKFLNYLALNINFTRYSVPISR